MKAYAALLAAVLAWPSAARAQDQPAPVDDACYNEIGILCHGLEGSRALACLDRYMGSLGSACRRSVQGEHDARRAKAEEAAQARAAAAAIAASGKSGKTEREARLVKLTGAVYVHTSRQPAEQYIAAEEGMPLAPGDIVRTGADGAADVSLDGESLISLAANTDFAVKSLEPADTDLFLGLGRVIAKIQKLLSGQQLRFSTPVAVAAVRGTELVVDQPEGERPAHVGVLDEGRVEVTGPSGGAPVVLAPHQETEVAAGKTPSAPQPLRALLAAQAAIAPLRGRLIEVRGRWKKQTAIERETRRVQLAQKPALPALNLPHVGPAQRQRAYPQVHQQQQRREPPHPGGGPRRR